jgi:Protein of unknown function (DUF742)
MSSGRPPARFVRQFALTGGRARSTGADLPFETLVQTTARGRTSSGHLSPEQESIVQLCIEPISIAEISAHLHIHLGIARVLVGDMGAEALVVISEPIRNESGPDTALLERLLHELEAL